MRENVNDSAIATQSSRSRIRVWTGKTPRSWYLQPRQVAHFPFAHTLDHLRVSPPHPEQIMVRLPILTLPIAYDDEVRFPTGTKKTASELDAARAPGGVATQALAPTEPTKEWW
jgi:hypothetical protein